MCINKINYISGKLSILMRSNGFLIILMALLTLAVSCGNGNNEEDASTSTTTITDTPTPAAPPPPPPNPIDQLERDLSEMDAKIQVKDRECRGLMADANASMMVATSTTASEEQKELARERVDISFTAYKECDSVLITMRNSLSKIQSEIRRFKGQ
jgi:hypothetical protein